MKNYWFPIRKGYSSGKMFAVSLSCKRHRDRSDPSGEPLWNVAREIDTQMNQPAKIAEIDQKMSHDLQRVLAADKDELFQVMQESGGEVLMAALRNRSLDENHLLALLKRRGLPEEIFTTLHSGRRFSESNPLKFALASHPETPSHITSSLLPQLYIFDLIKLCSLPGITPDQRLCAERIIIQRLPTQPLGNKLTLARREARQLRRRSCARGCRR